MDGSRRADPGLWILLSFVFYIPVAVFAGVMHMLCMLMLPKTVCYLVLVFTFYNAVLKKVFPSVLFTYDEEEVPALLQLSFI